MKVGHRNIPLPPPSPPTRINYETLIVYASFHKLAVVLRYALTDVDEELLPLKNNLFYHSLFFFFHPLNNTAKKFTVSHIPVAMVSNCEFLGRLGVVLVRSEKQAQVGIIFCFIIKYISASLFSTIIITL